MHEREARTHAAAEKAQRRAVELHEEHAQHEHEHAERDAKRN
jgi:hypothetical protein